MENEEIQYLDNIVKILNKRLKLNNDKLEELKNEFAQTKKDLGTNFSEYSRGDDLSERYASMTDNQARIEEMEKYSKVLETQIKSPYFARIDFLPKNHHKEQKIYIGITNLIYHQKIYIVDWRTPVASIYYDYNLGPASFTVDKKLYNGEILKKRQFKIEDGKLLSYFDTEMTINDDILKAVLSKNVTVKMKQIVSSIQKEQNAIIRKDKDKSILVQGIAGSGKTSIALHRAAYLLYKHKNIIKSNDILVLSPNNVFSSYISEVLPQLGEDNLVETTFAQIVRSELKRPVQSRETFLDEIVISPKQDELNELSYKSSYEYLDALLRFLKGPFLETYSPKDLSYCINDNEENPEYVTFSAEQTKQLFFKDFKGYDVYERINKIAWQYAMYFTELRHYNKEQNRGLKERFKSVLYNFFPIKDIDKIYQIFMARENLTCKSKNTINYMDKGTFLAIKQYMYGFDHKYTAKYLIIDEMQDFTPVDIYMFKRLWSCPCIVVGDVNQCIEKNLTEEYLNITADFLGCELLKLNKTYRSTKEIAQFSSKLIGAKNVEYVNRNGQVPTLYEVDNQIDKIVEIIKNECSTFDHIAIICKCNKEAKEIKKLLSQKIDCTLIENPDDYNNRVLITSCATAKGIEFDAVIVPNADKDNYNNTIDKNILYVSSTRALHKLFFVSEKKASPLLINSFLQKA